MVLICKSLRWWKWNSRQFDSTILLLFQHGWIKVGFGIVINPMRTAAINFSLGCTGENWFYERKNYVAHPPVPLNCCVENFRTTAMILARLRLPSTKGYSTPYIKCEMLSQNSTLFLDTVQVVQEKVVLFLYWKHGQEVEKSYYLWALP